MRDKARLCARGDLQSTPYDTYAATVAACVFRFCCALAAAFDLEMEQFDVVYAFRNAELPYAMYVRAPEDFQRPRYALRLYKALFGLKEAPMLWQADFRTSLEEFGLKSVPDVLCLYHDRTCLIFFYVDNIVVMYHKRHKNEANALKDRLFKRYEITKQGDLSWFLGIKVHRDRTNRQLYLLQDEYIQHIAHRFETTLYPERKTTTPIPTNMDWSTPADLKATKEEVHGYQERVGCINRCAIQIRPDVSKAASKLSQFFNQPDLTTPARGRPLYTLSARKERPVPTLWQLEEIRAPYARRRTTRPTAR